MTFTLQAVCRPRWKDAFDAWYSAQQDKLRVADYGRLFVALRNVTQKQGNRFPRVTFGYSDAHGNELHVTWHPTIAGPESIVSYGFRFAPGFGPGFSTTPDTTHEQFAALQREATTQAMVAANKLFDAETLKSATRVRLDVDFGDESPPMKFELFLDVCNRYVDPLDAIVREAEQKFPVMHLCNRT